MMELLSNPVQAAAMQAAFANIVTAILQIRDAVILQNYLTAIGVANASNVEVETVLAAARGYAGIVPVGESSADPS